MENAEKYLQRYLASSIEIARLEAEINTFSETDDVEREWIKDRIERMSRCRFIQSEILSNIDRVDNEVYRSILSFRFVCGMTWESIAQRLGYDVTHVVKRLRPKAFKDFEILLNNANKCP